MKINIVITNPTDGSSIREEKSFLLKKKFYYVRRICDVNRGVGDGIDFMVAR